MADYNEPLLSELDRDSREKVVRFKRWIDQSSRAFSIWREKAIESYRMVSNEQWPDQDLAYMEEQKRPALTINKIFPQIMWLLGVQRQQRTEPKLLPFEPGDARRADLMGMLYKWVGGQSREATVDSLVFQDKTIAGVGYWKVGVDFEKSIEGELVWERLHPLSVFPDPNFLDSGWEKADYVQQATWLTIEAAIDIWPEHKDRIRRRYGEWINEASTQGSQSRGGGDFAGDSLSDERTFWDPETQRIRVVECWYNTRVNVTVAMDRAAGQVIEDPEQVKALRQDPLAQMQYNFIKRSVRRVYVAHYVDDILLDDGPSPYRTQEFPIFPSIGYYFWRRPFGIVEVLKDLQREHNVRRSTMVEMVRRASLSGFFNDEAKGAKTEDITAYAAGVGKVINHRGIQPTEIRPPELPQTLVFLDQRSDQDMRAVTNIHSELLGNTSQRFVSGRAVQARQQSGLAVQEPLLESFKFDKEQAAKMMVSLIQQFIGPARAARILGSVVAREPEGPEAQLLGPEMAIDEIQDLLSSTFDEKWDIVIGEKPWEPSAKQQVLSALLDLLEKFGPDSVPPDMIVDALRDAGVLTEEHANRVRQYVLQRQQLQQATAMNALETGAVPPTETVQ